MSTRSAPAPGQAALPAPHAAALMRRNADEFGDRPAVRFGDQVWTHRDYFDEAAKWANLFVAQPASTPDGVLHVGVLLDNVPEYLFAFGGAALSGSVI